MTMYIKDRIRDEIYVVVAREGNHLVLLNAETGKKPWVIIRYSDVHPDERFYEVPCDRRGHQVMEKDTKV